jgi:hypothetical protein
VARRIAASREREAMSESDWIAKAAEHILQYIPNFHPYDAAKLAEDLQRSSPNLPPDDAVKFFFRPLRPQRGLVG